MHLQPATTLFSKQHLKLPSAVATMHTVACIIAMMALLRASSASPVPSDSKAAALENLLSEATQKNTQEMKDEAPEQIWGTLARLALPHVLNAVTGGGEEIQSREIDEEAQEQFLGTLAALAAPYVIGKLTGGEEMKTQELDKEAQEQRHGRGRGRDLCKIFKNHVLPHVMDQAQEIDKEAQEQIWGTLARLALPHVLNAVTGGGEEMKAQEMDKEAQEQFLGTLAALALPHVINAITGGEETQSQKAREQGWGGIFARHVLPHLVPHVLDAVTGGETQAQDLNKMALEQIILPFFRTVPAKVIDALATYCVM